jgi:hypothetical protein
MCTGGCESRGVPFKLYTSDKDCDSKEDFKHPDEAWRDVQVIVATATLTVAVDPREWHCDAVFVYAGSGMGCAPRDQRQAVERTGRQGQGDGPGQISMSNGVNGPGVYMLTFFDVKSEALQYESTVSKTDLFMSKRVGIMYSTQKKRRHMDSTFDATTLSAVHATPDWYTNVLAWNEVEEISHQKYIMHEWQEMCERRGWDFKVRTAYENTDASVEFDHGFARSVPPGLHDFVNSQTITLPHKGKETKYTRAIDILDVYGIVQSIVDTVVGESRSFATRPTIDLIEDIRKDDRQNSLLTQIAKDLYLFLRVLTSEE